MKLPYDSNLAQLDTRALSDVTGLLYHVCVAPKDASLFFIEHRQTTYYYKTLLSL